MKPRRSRARLDRTARLPAGRVENRRFGGEGAGRRPDLEIPYGDGALARLPGGRALRLRPFLRGLRIGGRGLTRPKDGMQFIAKNENRCYKGSMSPEMQRAGPAPARERAKRAAIRARGKAGEIFYLNRA